LTRKALSSIILFVKSPSEFVLSDSVKYVTSESDENVLVFFFFLFIFLRCFNDRLAHGE
jgi:hypothetical protein